jgi:chromate transporter
MASGNEAAAMPPLQDPAKQRSDVTLLMLLRAFVRLGLMTFGGSVQAWVHREIVDRLGWIDNKSFLSGLTVAQVLPGANPVNIALYVGLQLRGAVGAAVAVLGMIVPAFCVIMALGYLYRIYGHFASVRFVLLGLAASGVGATLTMGVRVGKRLPRNFVTGLIAVSVFLVVGILRWPMVPVVCAAVPLSIVAAYLDEKRRAANGL